MDYTNFTSDKFYGFGVEDEGSDMPQLDTRDPAYKEKKTNPTETEYGKITEEPHLDVNNIGNLDKYIGVTAKKNQ